MTIRKHIAYVSFAALAVIGACLAALGALKYPSAQGGWHTTWVWSAVGGTALAGIMPIGEAWRHCYRVREERSKAKEARVMFQVTINDAFGPLTSDLSKIASLSPTTRDAAKQAFIKSILSTARGLFSCSRVRASWYEVQGGPGGRVLAPAEYVGRNSAPSTVFREGAGTQSTEVFRSLDSGKPYFCPDTGRNPPDGFPASPPKDYKTFLQIPVKGHNKAYGMIFVDALEVGDLCKGDEGTIVVLAGMMATALSV